MILLIKKICLVREPPNYLLSAKLNVLYLLFEIHQTIFKIIASACDAKSFAMVMMIVLSFSLKQIWRNWQKLYLYLYLYFCSSHI